MATTIDWCEQNWVVSPYIAEFFNTLTSVACVLPPLYWWSLHTPKDSGAIPLMYPLLSFIMAGSAAFHGSMTWEGQLLDELPILLFCGFSFSILLDNYSLLPRSGPSVAVARAAWAPGPQVLTTVVLVEVAVLSYLYMCEHKIYAMFIGVVLIQAAAHWPLILLSLQRRFRWNPTAIRLLGMHVAFGYTGYALWCLENAFCEQLGPLNLHALWHVLATLSIKPYTDMLIYCRMLALHPQQPPRWAWRYGGLGQCFINDGKAATD